MPHAKPHLLLVEDNPLDALLLQYALTHVNVLAQLEVVVSVSDFRKQLESGRKLADLFLVDLSLGDGTGFDVIQSIRSSPENRNVPVIVFSGSDMDSDIQLAYSVGANAYVVKSSEMSYVIHALNHINEFWFDVVRLP